MNGVIIVLVIEAAQLEIEVDRRAVLVGEVLLGDAGVGMVGQLLLGVFRAAQDARHRLRAVGDIHAVFDLEVLEHMLDDLVVEIVAAEMVVAVAGDHLHHAFLDPHHRDVEGAAAQVVDEDALALVLRGLIDQRGRGRLIDDARHFQPGDLAGLARGLALRVGEIGRYGDHRLADWPSQPALGDLLQPRQDDRGDLLRRVVALTQADLRVAAHPPLDRADGPFRIKQELVARRLADEQFAAFGEPDRPRAGSAGPCSSPRTSGRPSR